MTKQTHQQTNHQVSNKSVGIHLDVHHGFTGLESLAVDAYPLITKVTTIRIIQFHLIDYQHTPTTVNKQHHYISTINGFGDCFSPFPKME